MTNREKFIEKANSKHKHTFDYSEFVYVNAKTKSIIECGIHGKFLQSPDKHLQSKYGCPECALVGRVETAKHSERVWYKPLKYTWEDIESALKIKFPELTFACTSYTGITSSIVLLCPEHGEHCTTVHNLMHKHVKCGCPKCGVSRAVSGKTGTFEEFVQEATTLYNGMYTYSCDNYTNRRSKVTIECSLHGTSIKSAQKHLSGQACFQCRLESSILAGKFPGGYCETIFNRNSPLKDRPGLIYYLKIGNLYKIGITINLERRVSSLRSKSSTHIEVIDTYETSLYEAYLIEQKILKEYAEFRTREEFSTELFTRDVLNGRILK